MIRKIKRIICMVMIATFALSFVNVNAQDGITIAEKSFVYPIQGTNDGKQIKYKTSKGYAYCIDPTKPDAQEGATLSFVGNVNIGGLLYLLDRANSENDYDYLVTQLAIWRYVNNFIPEYYVENSTSGVAQRASELARDAYNNSEYSIPNTSVSLEYDGAQLEVLHPNLIADKQPLRTGTITAHITNGQTSTIEFVNAPEGTKAYAMNGKELQSIEDGTQFYVVIPTASVNGKVNVEVKLTASGVVKNVERYSTNDNNYQDLVVISSTTTTASDQLYFEVTGRQYELKNCTYDENSKKYFDKDGNETNFETYNLQCVKHTCEKIGDTYFGNLGNTVSYEDYINQCDTPKCEIINGTYYGSNGAIVSSQEFINQCDAQIVHVPDTATKNIISIIIGLLILAVAGKCIIFSKNN